jgi:YceI-like domain
MRMTRALIAIALASSMTMTAPHGTARGAVAQAGAKLAPIHLGTGSTLWLNGTSSVHDFECRTSDLRLSVGPEAALATSANPVGFETLVRAQGIQSLALELPVASLRSGKSGLDKNLQKAMRADQYPLIRFQLKRYDIAAHGVKADTVNIAAEGALTVNGRERPEKLAARAYRDAAGLWLVGTKPLLMSDFDIKPPKMMLGTLKVHDPVTIHYKLLLAPASATLPTTSTTTP